MADKLAATANLSETQRIAVKYLSKRGEAARMDFYHVGIRMPTVYSLVRKGLVTSERRECDDGKIRTFYKLVAGE